jgi:predicted DNA-binding transcriptional regulator AlpA
MIDEYLSTGEFADAIGVAHRTIHDARTKLGHFHSFQPVELPNGRLAWPRKYVDAWYGRRTDKTDETK